MKIHKEAKVPSFLKELNLFEGLEHSVINQIFRLGLVQHFKKGDSVIREGQYGGRLYILINGKAEVVKSVKGSRTKVKKLAIYNRGSVFGEMSVFDGAPYSATVRTLAESDIHIIRGSDLENFLKKNPASAYLILRTLLSSISNRLRRTNQALSLAG